MLRRLSNYLRASTDQGRLSNLALIHANYEKEFDLEEIVDSFARKHSRRMELESIIRP